ncbi:MAG: ABC transporter permease [Actinomycetota bacterium]|nr:ABC transporter permease [Actinomycetota bacterium]
MSTVNRTEPARHAVDDSRPTSGRADGVATAVRPLSSRQRRPGALSVIRSEWIKLRSTRSPWWCMAVALLIPMAFGILITNASEEGNSIFFSLAGMQFAAAVILVLAALAVTSEYRFGTIRTTLQAQPSRTRVLWTKAGVIAAVAFLIGEVAAWTTFAVSRFFDETGALVLRTADDWRLVAGYGLVYALLAVIAVAVGSLVRHPAGALTLLLVWSLAIENLISIIPNFGDDIYRLLPFVNGTLFAGDPQITGVTDPLSTLGSLGVLAGTAFVLLGVATAVLHRRDA